MWQQLIWFWKQFICRPLGGEVVKGKKKDKKLDVLSNQMHCKNSNHRTWSKQSFYIITTDLSLQKKFQKIIKPYFKGGDKHTIEPLFIPFKGYVSIY